MKTYTVVAVYDDGEGERYCTHVEAESPADAEEKAQRQCAQENGMDYVADEPPLLIAGVFEGKLYCADGGVNAAAPKMIEALDTIFRDGMASRVGHKTKADLVNTIERMERLAAGALREAGR